MSESYKERIVDYMFNEYKQGRTPNPDVLCNREIKFDLFLKTALGLGADYVATGHYARKSTTVDANGNEVFQLLKGVDNNKDQSYFLCQLSQEQLSKALFPIGELEKSEVRRIAKEQGLVTADKKDSQGLCFIGKVSLPEFLQQQLKAKKGEIIEVAKDWKGFEREVPTFNNKYEALDFEARGFSYTKDSGEIVGTHQGAHYFTRGQRKGLGVGGKVEPLFVIATDVKENIIYTGQGANHPGLLKKALFIKEEEVHWVREDLALKEGETMEVMARIRYRQPLQVATLHKAKEGMYVEFLNPQSAITEGQFCAWHIGDELAGSGVINY